MFKRIFVSALIAALVVTGQAPAKNGIQGTSDRGLLHVYNTRDGEAVERIKAFANIEDFKVLDGAIAYMLDREGREILPRLSWTSEYHHRRVGEAEASEGTVPPTSYSDGGNLWLAFGPATAGNLNDGHYDPAVVVFVGLVFVGERWELTVVHYQTHPTPRVASIYMWEDLGDGNDYLALVPESEWPAGLASPVGLRAYPDDLPPGYPHVNAFAIPQKARSRRRPANPAPTPTPTATPNTSSCSLCEQTEREKCFLEYDAELQKNAAGAVAAGGGCGIFTSETLIGPFACAGTALAVQWMLNRSVRKKLDAGYKGIIFGVCRVPCGR